MGLIPLEDHDQARRALSFAVAAKKAARDRRDIKEAEAERVMLANGLPWGKMHFQKTKWRCGNREDGEVKDPMKLLNARYEGRRKNAGAVDTVQPISRPFMFLEGGSVMSTEFMTEGVRYVEPGVTLPIGFMSSIFC